MKLSLTTFALLAAGLVACSSASENGDSSEEQPLNGCPHHFTLRSAGGTVLSDVGIVNVYWGPWWTSADGAKLRARQDASWKILANDPRFYRPLQEYMPAGTTIRGQFLTSAAVYSDLAPNTILTQDQLENELAHEIASGELPGIRDGVTPAYFIYLPPDVLGPPLKGADGDNIDYLAYHHAMTLPGTTTQIAYGVAMNEMVDTLDVAEGHELYEMITNPFDNGWRDRIKDSEGLHAEVADACDGNPAMLDNHTVQQVWSERSCSCVSP